jgi:hypothetical protein
MTITIRPVTQADLPQLSRLWYEKAALQYPSDSRFQLALDGQARWEAAVAAWLGNAAYSLWTAEREATLLGYIIGQIEPSPPGLIPERIGVIRELTVDLHGNARTVGQLLLEALRGWFAAQNIRHTIAYVPPRQAVEQAFWGAQGATEWMNILWLKSKSG